MDVKPSCLNSQRAALSGNMQMMQPFLLDRINPWGYSYPLGGLIVQCRWHSQRLGCRLLQPMGRGKSQWLGGIQWRMCGVPSSTWQFLWGRWFGLRLCNPQRHAGSMPRRWNSKDLFRALLVPMRCPRWWRGTLGPHKRKKTTLWSRDECPPTRGWDHQAFQINVGLEPFRAFWLVHFLPLIFSLYWGVLVARTVFM